MIQISKYKERFSNWMRYNPPGALSGGGWDAFYKEFSEVAPLRYWVTDVFRRKYILPIIWKYEKVSEWVAYRTYRRYHVIDTGLNPGYHEIESQMLHANFSMLVRYVEFQLGNRHYWAKLDRKTHKEDTIEKYFPFIRDFFPVARAEYGVEHLMWEMTLDDPALPPYEQAPAQAKCAREIHALYIWWTQTRPSRIKIEIEHDQDIPGAARPVWPRINKIDRNSTEYKAYRANITAQANQEEKWRKEDDKMLVRLVKVRSKLWT